MENGTLYTKGQIIETPNELDRIFRGKFQLVTAATEEYDARQAELEAMQAKAIADQRAAQAQQDALKQEMEDNAVVSTDLPAPKKKAKTPDKTDDFN